MIVSWSNLACTKKTVWTRSILSNLLVILNILASRRGWTFFGMNFFEVLKKKRGSIRSERQREEYGVRLRNDAKIAIFEGQPYFWNWNELKFTFPFTTTFSANKIDPKVIGFFAYHYNNYNKLSIVNFSLPKVS